jgi:chromate transporter
VSNAPKRGMHAAPPAPSFREALGVWTRIGLLSFGGPAGQIALMHRVLVEEKRWIGERHFLHALNYCMLLPGPEAQQLAIYVGWLLHRTPGGIAAGTLFVLPGFATVLALTILYAAFRDLHAVDALFYGLKPAVLAVVVEAVLRIGRRALTGPVHVAIAAAAFAAIFLFAVPFPAIVAAAALIGALGVRLLPAAFRTRASADAREATAADAALDLAHARPSLARALRVVLVWGALWLGPIALLAVALGGDSIFVAIATFFSKAAVVTFGGAYSVLAYIAEEAVHSKGWLAPGEMLDGLGLAETTPGPLILVTNFIGFLAAYRHASGLDPLLAGSLGAALTSWVTFVPCFLWIFLGAPYIEALRGNRWLHGSLSAITAAVVGVVLNLAVWFALHTVFHTLTTVHAGWLQLLVPSPASLDPASLAIAAAALVAMLRFRVGVLPTLAASAAVGALWRLVGLG